MSDTEMMSPEATQQAEPKTSKRKRQPKVKKSSLQGQWVDLSEDFLSPVAEILLASLSPVGMTVYLRLLRAASAQSGDEKYLLAGNLPHLFDVIGLTAMEKTSRYRYAQELTDKAVLRKQGFRAWEVLPLRSFINGDGFMQIPAAEGGQK